MAEENKSQDVKESLIDGVMLNEFITLYLYGVYAFKRGRLTPPQAMQKVVQMSRMMEKATAVGKAVRKRVAAYYKKED